SCSNNISARLAQPLNFQPIASDPAGPGRCPGTQADDPAPAPLAESAERRWSAATCSSYRRRRRRPAPRRRLDRGRRRVRSSILRNLFVLSRLRTFDVRMAGPVVRQVRASDPGWWAGLSRFAAPTLLVHGGARGEVPIEDLQRMVQALPDGRITTIEAGHRTHSRRPDAFSAAVVPFLS
ncbi:MAG: alpha/beta fold hydrolase, partial [Frankia sp.]